MSTAVTKKEPVETLPAPSELGIELKSVAETRLESPSLKNVIAINKKVATTHIYMLITSTYIKCGQTIEADKVATTTSLFLEELEDYEYLTIKEINKAFKDGYKGHYGKYYGLNVLTFITWIEYYIKNVRMDELAKHLPNEPVAELPEISDSAKELILKNGCIRCFNDFKESGYLPVGSLHIYEYLNEKEILVFTDNELADIEIKSIQDLRTKAANGSYQRKEFAKIFRDLKNPDNSRVESKKQHLKLAFFLQKLIDKKESIETYL